MVKVEREGDKVVFQVVGPHKMWAFKSRLEIPAASIRGARRDPEAVHGWKGWKVLGTYLPGLITAGTFYHDGRLVFWDVIHAEGAVVVDLEDEKYHQLVIEVEDPETIVELLTAVS